MADDLDDFFAKKDKKVGKKPKGKITNEKLAKKLEGAKDTEKKEKKKKEKLQEPSVTEQDNPEETPKDEKDEWLPFEEEAEVDLTGLKIQKLEISESGNDDDDHQGSGEERNEGQDENNPWKVAQQQQQVERKPSPEPEPEEKPEPVPAPAPQPASKAPSSYVPPHMRQSQQSALKPKIIGRGGRSKKAPDITNQESFPSLECATQEAPPSTVGPWGRKTETGFESVRHGSRTSADTQESRGPKLNLGNMYSALQDS